MPQELPIIQGRGTSSNPPNRFERLQVEEDFEHVEGEEGFLDSLTRRETAYYVDSSKSIIASNDSPDVGFTHSINPYRGCSHGCIYCYARPTHEYLGFSAGLDFETKIMVKMDAPELLRRELSKRSWKPQVIAIGGVTDPYQPAEKQFRITRKCLEVLAEFRNPAAIVSKSGLVMRDLDVLSEMAKWRGIGVYVSVTTLDAGLSAKMEPRGSAPARRLEAIRQLAAAGVWVGVMVAPVVPGLTDHEVPGILKAARQAGAKTAGMVPLRLPGAVGPLFEEWLGRHYPDRKEKVLNRVRELRGGKLNDPNFGSRMRGEGQWAEQLSRVFEMGCRRAGFDGRWAPLSAEEFRVPDKGGQMGLFE